MDHGFRFRSNLPSFFPFPFLFVSLPFHFLSFSTPETFGVMQKSDYYLVSKLVIF